MSTPIFYYFRAKSDRILSDNKHWQTVTVQPAWPAAGQPQTYAPDTMHRLSICWLPLQHPWRWNGNTNSTLWTIVPQKLTHGSVHRSQRQNPEDAPAAQYRQCRQPTCRFHP